MSSLLLVMSESRSQIHLPRLRTHCPHQLARFGALPAEGERGGRA